MGSKRTTSEDQVLWLPCWPGSCWVQPMSGPNRTSEDEVLEYSFLFSSLYFRAMFLGEAGCLHDFNSNLVVLPPKVSPCPGLWQHNVLPLSLQPYTVTLPTVAGLWVPAHLLHHPFIHSYLLEAPGVNSVSCWDLLYNSQFFPVHTKRKSPNPRPVDKMSHVMLRWAWCTEITSLLFLAIQVLLSDSFNSICLKLSL